MKQKTSFHSAFIKPRVLFAFAVCLIAALLALVGLGAFTGSTAQAQGDDMAAKAAKEMLAKQQPSAPRPTGVISVTSERNDVSPPLRDQPPWPVRAKAPEREANANPKIPHKHVDGVDPVVQNAHASMLAKLAPSIPAPNRNFDGIPFPGVSCNCAPPDTNGEVGATQFVQMVNEGLQVWNKAAPTPASLLGPVSINSIWVGFGGVCETGGSGDPVVLYDQLADRWVISQFAGSPPTHECIAVSKTNDATGVWNRYDFSLIPFGANFYDYPHLGVWPDGYYMAMNVFNGGGTAFLGAQAFAFDRAKMLVGLPATVVSPGILAGGATDETFLPADVDGLTPPTAGAPETFVYWPGGASANMYRVMHFHADFAIPANTTFTPFASVASAAFTALCPTTRACVPELGSPATLDAIGDRLMFRLAYRKFADGHEAVVGNFTVSSAAVGGVRWFELRGVTAGPVTLFQESTYQPDTTWRWMGSTAMDNQGNLALGFSASDANINPQLRYAGRLAGDPVGVLSQGEAHLFDGTGSQTSALNRWGDYSDLTVDPVDDCTFWYTQEYIPSNGTFNWRTRAGSFAFTQCTPPAKGTAHFIVTFCQGGAALADAVVSIDGNVYGSSLATTGFYDAMLIPGPHTYSVSKPTFGTVTGNFNITNGATTNVPVCLVGTPVIVAAGSTLGTEGCAPPNMVIDPAETVTVALKLMNNGGASTTNLVATLQNSGGVTPITVSQNYGVIAPTGMASANFTFTNTGTCGGMITATLQLQDGANNLGNVTFTYTLGVLSVTLSENFDGAVVPALPAGWTTLVGSNTLMVPPWQTSSTGTPTPVADSAPNAAFTQDPANLLDSAMITPSFTYTGAAQMSCRMNYDIEQSSATVAYDAGALEISINGGAYADIITAGGSWVTGGYDHTSISGSFSNPFLTVAPTHGPCWSGISNGGAGGFQTTTVNLPASGIGQMVQLRWRMGSDSSVAHTGWRVDNVVISGAYVCCAGGPPVPQSAVSRKMHTGVGNFDVPLPLVPVSGAVGIEPRLGPAYTMVVTFASSVTTTGATVTTGTGTVGSVTGSGTSTIVINLTGVTDVQRLGVTLNNVNDGMGHVGNVLIPMGVLVGDTNASGGVSGADVAQTKAQSGQPAGAGNFRTDVNASGGVSGADIAAVKAQSGHVLPP